MRPPFSPKRGSRPFARFPIFQLLSGISFAGCLDNRVIALGAPAAEMAPERYAELGASLGDAEDGDRRTIDELPIVARQTGTATTMPPCMMVSARRRCGFSIGGCGAADSQGEERRDALVDLETAPGRRPSLALDPYSRQFARGRPAAWEAVGQSEPHPSRRHHLSSSDRPRGS